jgi:hypothetical protein
VSIAANRDAVTQLAAIQKARDSAGGSAPSSAAGITGSPDSIRTATGAFGARATSTKPPEELFAQLQRVLAARRIESKPGPAKYALVCTSRDPALSFLVEVCRIANLEGYCAIQAKRIHGDTFLWKDFWALFLGSLSL